MAELNPVAKRIDNVSPAPVRLLLSDGSSGVFKMQNTEFLQAEFQAEGHRIDDESAYRFITSDDGEEILAGRRSDSTDEWTLVGEVLQAEAVDEDSVDHTSESDAESDTDAKSTTEETEEITLDPENVNEVNIED